MFGGYDLHWYCCTEHLSNALICENKLVELEKATDEKLVLVQQLATSPFSC